ncbi:MAG: UDP-N-acetylglucosamine 1-carboxyvinyltransferase [Anaerolineae bacterium]|nr:UDP-N-acetylglucosamine 1-carboxyvinyltransferase [Anaerolineae bacterium]
MRIHVEGQHPLSGSYRPSGNVNAALALLAASLLTDQPMTLRNVPRTTTFDALAALAERLGAQMTWADDNTVRVETAALLKRVLTTEDTQSSVGSILFIAPLLLHRRHVRFEVDFPLNRIRTHLEALRDLGLDVINSEGAVECKAETWKTRDILLAQASVTATALTLMLAATLGEQTTIHNAACEPHVQALSHMLVQMGARIDGIGSNVLTVYGAEKLGGADVTIRPDHIEAASLAAITALTGGRLQIESCQMADLRMVDKIYRRLGIQLDMDETALFVPKHDILTVSNREEDVDASIETGPWPAFPSDLVAIATVIATQARGTSLIHEKLFSNRLLFVDKLKAMGAQIVLCDPHRAIVVGQTPLRGIYMDTPDVRAGLGLLAAALIAEGTTVIDGAQAIEQTFADALSKIQALGAHISLD